MKITLNNRKTSFESESLAVTELFTLMKYTFPMIVVKINGLVIKKDRYGTTIIHDGDTVEAIHLISGG
ncbi:MAG: sulfur carrier protein ThiS [Candidatus Aminicenantes bacterium]|nr:sulfur carrier protein ThiS [Candidatus Aminicenantes bacterium]